MNRRGFLKSLFAAPLMSLPVPAAAGIACSSIAHPEDPSYRCTIRDLPTHTHGITDPCHQNTYYGEPMTRELTEESLERVIIEVSRQTNERGIPFNIKPSTLIIPRRFTDPNAWQVRIQK